MTRTTAPQMQSEKSQVMICKWLFDCSKVWSEGQEALLITFTLPVTHQGINHNYDKISQLNVEAAREWWKWPALSVQ